LAVPSSHPATPAGRDRAGHAGHGDTCAEDLLGSYVPLPDGRFAFSHGPAVTAMREGRALFVDDATLM
jgi:midasin (ATPase involved in ribosome maturation)